MLIHTNQNTEIEPSEEPGINIREAGVQSSPEVPLIQLSFSVLGQAIPVDHGYELFSALAHFQPELHDLEQLSIQTITNTTYSNRSLLLSKRSKLRIRLPVNKVPLVYPLAGRSLVLGVNKVRLGIPQMNWLQSARTLYSRMVVIKGQEQPELFLKAAQNQLQSLGVTGESRISTGSNGLFNRKTVKVRGYTVVGYGLEMVNLNDEDSLKLQAYGIGGKRKMGCGIFVPK